MKIDSLSKRLLTASRLGITFDYADGHRWVYTYDQYMGDNPPFIETLEFYGLTNDGKIYGTIIDALDYVDDLLTQMKQKTLENQFDEYNDWGLEK